MLCGHAPFHTPNCSTKEMVDHIQHGYVSYDGPEWINVSSQAKDLISGLLTVNASQRLTLDSLTRHPWLIPDSAPATPLHTHNGLQKMGAAETAINYTLHAYHQAAKVGVVLGDPSRAPLAKKRKRKAGLSPRPQEAGHSPRQPEGEEGTIRPNTLNLMNDVVRT